MKRIAIFLLALLILPIMNAHAQFMPEFEEVEGKYVNDELGIEVTLPEGWRGFEIPSIALQTGVFGGFVAAPGGIDMMEGFDMSAPTMFLYVMDAKKFENTKVTEPESVTPTEEPTEQNCRILSFGMVTVSGANGIQGVIECDTEDIDGNPITLRIKGVYLSQEKQGSIRTITLGYMASVDRYDDHVTEFDEALQTLSVRDAKPLSLSLENEVVKKVTVEDQELDVKILTNSEVKELTLNEQDKSIELSVEGEDGTIGSLEIYLGNVLKGPYTVLVDDTPIEAMQVVDENGVEGVKIFYFHSSRDIKIVGTEVVPEFSIAVLPILALVTGMLIFLSRHKPFKP